MVETNKVYCEDCLLLLEKINDDSIDLTVTSPPYENIRNYKGSLEWNQEIWQEAIRTLYRITKIGGVVVWVVGDVTMNGSESGTSFKQSLHAIECGFNLHDTMIWNKGSCRYPETNRYYPCFEYMFVWSKGKPKTYNLIKDRKNIYSGAKIARKKQIRNADGTITENSAYRKDKNRKIGEYGVRFNIWNIPVSACEGTKEHPATFPEILAKDHILSWSNEQDIILDPFCGSGTTGKLAKQLNRQYIMVDKVREYCDYTERKIGGVEWGELLIEDKKEIYRERWLF